jgi:glycosyltransferase involved in cell wall biosynthesis
MRDSKGVVRPTLLVLASTYPRWSDDHEPGFVHELAKRLTDRFNIIALVPSAPGAAPSETLEGVEVVRYRYAPRRFETLVNDGGIVTNLRRHRWKVLLVPTFILGQAWRTWHLLRTRRIDVVHAHWLIPQGLIVAVLSKWSGRCPPYLVTSHGADLFALRGKGLDALKRLVVRRATAATVVSESMRIELERLGADVSKVSVQPMGVDLKERFTLDASVERSRDEILFVGRLVEKKGLRHLIDAMPEIVNRYPTAYLTVAGFGPEQSERQAQVQRLNLGGKVHFVGSLSQPELPPLYRRAAVFVAPFVQADSGDQEGLGLVVVEAAGCGCPVVVSDLPAVQDVFETFKAHRVAPGSATSIAEAVCKVLAVVSQGDGIASNVGSSLYDRFDWSVVADNYAWKLRGVADKRSQIG